MPIRLCPVCKKAGSLQIRSVKWKGRKYRYPGFVHYLGYKGKTRILRWCHIKGSVLRNPIIGYTILNSLLDGHLKSGVDFVRDFLSSDWFYISDLTKKPTSEFSVEELKKFVRALRNAKIKSIPKELGLTLMSRVRMEWLRETVFNK